ncbi:MAG: Radical SAM protein [Magnetococcales bacterium]|nr:Radical SAM protein [Magnetococcales bacterium]HIJ85749.1 B12-binding domain-containing radical SAM protein [Magnetococcales bacterium]
MNGNPHHNHKIDPKEVRNSRQGHPRPTLHTIGPIKSDPDRAKLKFALVRGPGVFSQRSVISTTLPSFGLAMLMGYLRARGYDPIFVDAVGEELEQTWQPEKYLAVKCHGLTFAQICERIPKDVDVIGVHAMFSVEWPITRDLIHALRNYAPNALIIAGGEHATAVPEYNLKDCPSIDILVRGEGERVLFEILETARKNSRSFNHIFPISYLDENGNYVETSSQTSRIRDIDNLSWPYWPEGYLEKFWDLKKTHVVNTGRDIYMMVSRGCPYLCTFCSSAQMWTNRYTLRDVNDVIAEIKYYKERFDITGIQFEDLTSVVTKRWLVDFCNKLLDEKLNVSWAMPSTRSECMDEESLLLMKKAGCIYVAFSPESANPRILELIKKNVNLDHITAAALNAKKVGLIARINMIIGFQDETRKEIINSMWYALKMSFKGVDEVLVSLFSIYPGSEMFNDSLKKGKIKLGDEFFLSLNLLNSDLTQLRPMVQSEKVSPLELGIYRTGFWFLSFLVGYLAHPKRIVRTFKVMFFNANATTVFENRLSDLAKRIIKS